MNKIRIGIGIDTGGTYTDAVAYDFDSREILGSAKSLTTKDDLTRGILGALDSLPDDLLKKTELISLSTTLATNACVEDKGGRAKLVFFGGNTRVIDELGSKYGLPKSRDIYIQESYTNISGESDREVDWDKFSGNLGQEFDGFESIAVVEINAMRNGALAEKKAKEILVRKYDVPVVCGHELFSELNSLQRASSVLLNARLFPVIDEFLDSIKRALRDRDISAHVVIVRSDGSMMSEEFASMRPVEMLLSGPSASAFGGICSTDEENSVIIDMGGTTTDIAVVKNRIPVTVTSGVSIGKWKTFVDGLYIKTIGLGGDTAIHYRDKTLYLEDHRIIPVCVAAQLYPSVLVHLRKLAEKMRKHTMFIYEHYILIKDIGNPSRYTADERAFCEALKGGPLSVSDAPGVIGKDMYNINVSRLIKEGVIGMCGLTPTDIMHIKGDFRIYSLEAAFLCAKIVAYNLDISVNELCDLVYTEIKRKLYRNIAVVLLENKHPHYMKNGVNEDVIRFIDESFESAGTGKNTKLLDLAFQTDYSLIGIGAPIKIFLDDVAKLFGTKAVIPDHFEVANAFGAIAGNVSATNKVEIQTNYSPDGVTGYTVFGNSVSVNFEKIEDAREYAIMQAVRGAEDEALRRGARGQIAVNYSLDENIAPYRDGSLYLGSTITARAVGSVGF